MAEMKPIAPPGAEPTPNVKEELKQLRGTAILGILWTVCPGVLGLVLLGYLPAVADFLNSLGPWAWPVYVAIFMVSAGVGFLPTFGQAFLGGWAFGFWIGFPGAMLGFVGGSSIGYLIARTVSREKALATINAHPKAKAVRDALVGSGFWKTVGIVSLVRLPPNMPFSLTNLLMASSGVNFLAYLIGTAIGMAPRTAVAVWIMSRAKLENPDANNMLNVITNTPWQQKVLFGAVLVGVLSALIYIGNRAIAHVTTPGPKTGA